MIHNIWIHLPFHTQLELTSTTKIKSIVLFHAAAGVQRRAWRRVPAGYNRVAKVGELAAGAALIDSALI